MQPRPTPRSEPHGKPPMNALDVSCPACSKGFVLTAARHAMPAPPFCPDCGRLVQWYFHQEGRSEGPVAWDQVLQLVCAGRLHSCDRVWPEGAHRSFPADAVFDGLPAATPAAPSHVPATALVRQYWLWSSAGQLGPYPPQHITKWLAGREVLVSGEVVCAETLACPEGGNGWVPLGRIPEFQQALPASPASAVTPAESVAPCIAPTGPPPWNPTTLAWLGIVF